MTWTSGKGGADEHGQGVNCSGPTHSRPTLASSASGSGVPQQSTPKPWRQAVTANPSATSPGPSRMRSLSNPTVRSASLQKSVVLLTSEELRASLAAARPPQPWSIWQALRAGFWRSSICRGLARGLQCATLQSALRWPRLQTLLPSVRRRVRWAALLDRALVESGGVLSTAAPAAAVRRLKSYREEWDRLEVIPAAAPHASARPINLQPSTLNSQPA